MTSLVSRTRGSGGAGEQMTYYKDIPEFQVPKVPFNIVKLDSKEGLVERFLG